jgi:hypothetical protein
MGLRLNIKMKLHLFVSTAAVLFGAFSGSAAAAVSLSFIVIV